MYKVKSLNDTYTLLLLRLPPNIEVICRSLQSSIPFHPILFPFIPLRWLDSPLSAGTLQRIQKSMPLLLESKDTFIDHFLWLRCHAPTFSDFLKTIPDKKTPALFSFSHPPSIFLDIASSDMHVQTIPCTPWKTGALWLTQLELHVYHHPWWHAFQWRISWTHRITVQAHAPYSRNIHNTEQ